MNIAINGFGRIGKNFLRILLLDNEARKKIKVAVINIGPSNRALVGHLFKYDSIMGKYPGCVKLSANNELIVDEIKIPIIAETDSSKLPWKDYGIDWVVDCSGKYTERKDAEKHLKAGAKAVLISAPANDEDVSIVAGVNDAMFDKAQHKIVSLGSCTTNALMPMLKVLYESCGLQQGFMSTVHAYTPSQPIHDSDGKDARKSRAAGLNIIPTSTGASKMVGKIIPALAGKIETTALRIPLPKVSFLEITFLANKPLTREDINKAFNDAAHRSLKKILSFSEEPCVSSDYAGTEYSVIVDGLMTRTLGAMGTVFGWYDNEWAYSVRLKDFLLSIQ